MPLYINKRRISPTPFVTISKENTFSDDGRIIDSNFNINLKGTLLPNHGVPTVSGWPENTDLEPPVTDLITDEDKFDSLLRKQEFLREAFQIPGAELRYHASGSLTDIDTYPVTCNIFLKNINFEPDNWVIKTHYSIDLETNYINKAGTSGVEDTFHLDASGLGLSSVSDDWTIKERADGTSVYEITRNVSATARSIWSGDNTLKDNLEPWENAKSWVEKRIISASGLDNSYFNFPITDGSYLNIVEEENINKLAGSYSIQQTFLYHNLNYVEDRSIARTIERPLSDNNSPTIENITINGTISGLSPNNDASGKIDNARNYWNTLKDTLASYVNASGEYLNYSVDEDITNGILTYSMSFINHGGSTYTHDYSVSLDFSDGSNSSVTINGEISGVTDDTLPTGKFDNAKAGWNIIEPTLKSLAFTEASTIWNNVSSGYYSAYPVGKSVSYNPANATISYSYNYAYTTATGQLYSDEYTIDYSTDNPQSLTQAGYKVQATINGVIKGLSSTDDQEDRITNARTGWNKIQALLYDRVNNNYSEIGNNIPSLRNTPISRTVTVDTNNGVITYSSIFNNDPDPPAGVAVADVNISENYKNDIFAVQTIPGRSAGPIIQNIDTVSEHRRTIDVSLTMHPDSGNHWEYSSISTPRTIASGLIASGLVDLGGWSNRTVTFFVESDSDNWDWKAGFYTRNISIVYTP